MVDPAGQGGAQDAQQEYKKAGGFWGAEFNLGPLVVVQQGGYVGFYKILLMFFQSATTRE